MSNVTTKEEFALILVFATLKAALNQVERHLLFSAEEIANSDGRRGILL
ncbi:hypothetical protein [Streptococcus orisratti]|nr:hypothetical protein [Streptococcus orisratti]